LKKGLLFKMENEKESDEDVENCITDLQKEIDYDEIVYETVVQE